MGVFGTNSEMQDMKAHVGALKIDQKSATVAGATLTLTADNDGQTINFNRAAGCIVTLPAATGSGIRYRFIVGVTVTSNNYVIQVADSTDEFAGTILQTDTDTSDTLISLPAIAADNYDTITLNGSTKGGLIGDWIEVEDVATNLWAVFGHINGNGTVASPWSAAV